MRKGIPIVVALVATTVLALPHAARFASAGCDGSRARSAWPPSRRAARPQVITVPSEYGTAARPCAAQPQNTCETPGRSRLIVRNSLDSSKDALIWKWRKGDAFEMADLGSPSDSAKYALCVYDSIESARMLTATLEVEPGRGWIRDADRGWNYRDPQGKSAGITRVQLRTGTIGRTRVRVAARGRQAEIPPPVSGTQFFHKDGGVVVQLVNALNGECWTSTFTTAKENTPQSFLAP